MERDIDMIYNLYYAIPIPITITITIFLYFPYKSGPPGTAYEGGVFPALLTFPKDYPLSPPSMKFTCDLFHPNSKRNLSGM